MNLLQVWRRPPRPSKGYTNDAIFLFARFSRRHDLSYNVLDAPADVMWEFPIQRKLTFPIILGLQNNDELNFGVPGFWSYFFPFPTVAEKFESYLDAWVAGEARITHHPRLFRFISASTLELPINGKWTQVYKSTNDRWRHTSLTIQNLAT